MGASIISRETTTYVDPSDYEWTRGSSKFILRDKHKVGIQLRNQIEEYLQVHHWAFI